MSQAIRTFEVGAVRRGVAIIDAKDWPRVRKHRWRYNVNGPVRPIKVVRWGLRVSSAQSLHRFILNASPEQRVRPLNGNRWDCRRSNLVIEETTPDYIREMSNALYRVRSTIYQLQRRK